MQVHSFKQEQPRHNMLLNDTIMHLYFVTIEQKQAVSLTHLTDMR